LETAYRLLPLCELCATYAEALLKHFLERDQIEVYIVD